MINILILLTALVSLTTTAAYSAPKVTYIDAPNFPGQIYLYGEPKKADVDFEQWYEIEGRGQFVRNVKVPTLIPYLPEKENSNGAAIIIAPAVRSFIILSEAEAMRRLNGSNLRDLQLSF